MKDAKPLPLLVDRDGLIEFFPWMKCSFIYEKTSRKEMPHYKVGTKLLFDPVEVKGWLTSNKVDTQEELKSEVITEMVTSSNNMILRKRRKK